MATFGTWLEGKGVAIPGEPGQLARYWRDSKGRRPRASGVETIKRWILADTDRIDPNITSDGAEAAMATLAELYHRAQAGHLGAAQQEAATGGSPGEARALLAQQEAQRQRLGHVGAGQQPDQAADGLNAYGHIEHPPQQPGPAGDPAAAADDPPYQDRAYAAGPPVSKISVAPAGTGSLPGEQQPDPAADGQQPGQVTAGPLAFSENARIALGLGQSEQLAPLVQEIRTEWHEQVTAALTHILEGLAIAQASHQHIRGMLGTLDAKLTQILDWQADVDWQAAQEPGQALEDALADPDLRGAITEVVDALAEDGAEPDVQLRADLAEAIGQQIREDQAAGNPPWQRIMRGDVPGWRLECPNPACAELDGQHVPGCDAVSIPRQLRNVGRPMHSHTPAELCAPGCPSYGPPPQPPGQPLSFYGQPVPRAERDQRAWAAPPLQPWMQEPDGPYGISEVPGG